VSGELYIEVIKRSKVLDLGLKRISRTVRNYKGQPRFVIYLPITRNYIWGFLWERKIPVKVFLEIPEGAIKEDEENREVDQK
jgi:hypothetical protein